MHSMAADGDEKKQARFRLLNAARYLVASVVTVLIIAVIVNAVKVLVRPESLAFSVRRGSVFARRIQHPPTLLLDLDLVASNPNGRALVYYSNFTAYLFDRNTPASSPNPEEDCFLYIHVNNNVARPQRRVETLVQVNTKSGLMTPSFFDMLYNRNDATIDGVTMRLEGSVITQINSGYNTTPHWTTYNCGPLVVGGKPDDDASQNMPDVSCTEVQRT